MAQVEERARLFCADPRGRLCYETVEVDFNTGTEIETHH